MTADVPALLTEHGPLATDAISRLMKRGASSARKRLEDLRAAGVIGSRKVVTRRFRNGVHLWFVAGESEERIEGAIAVMRGARESTFNRPFRAA